MFKKPIFAKRVLEKDIKYRGKLTFRGLRIIGWFAMAFFFLNIVLNFGYTALVFLNKIDAADKLMRISDVFSYFAVLPLPLFFIANFGIITNNRHAFKSMIIKFSILALAIWLLFVFVHYRYGLVFAKRIESKDPTVDAMEILHTLDDLFFSKKLAFNVFIDLLLCTLVTFFVDYRPKEYFKGKKIYLFRSLVAIPIIYELVGVYLKGFHGFYFKVPAIVAPLLPTKPLLLFLMYLGIVLFMKFSERRCLKHDMTLGEYHKYLKTNGSSLTFSITVSVGLLIASAIDLVFSILALNLVFNLDFTVFLVQTGTTETMCVFFAIPIILLYSYNKEPKPAPTFDLLIPLGGIGLVVIAIIEGAFAVFMSM